MSEEENKWVVTLSGLSTLSAWVLIVNAIACEIDIQMRKEGAFRLFMFMKPKVSVTLIIIGIFLFDIGRVLWKAVKESEDRE